MLKTIINAVLAFLKPDMTPEEVALLLEERASHTGERLNWRTSIVDLLKLLNLDSSLAARRTLAIELGYTGADPDGSEAKNIWLHKKVLEKIASHGIKVPT